MTNPSDLRIVCAWCKAPLGGPVDAPNVSHGICPACLATALEEIEDAPIIVEAKGVSNVSS